MSYEDLKTGPRHQSRSDGTLSTPQRSIAPGKQTRTMSLPSRAAGASEPVQMKSDPAMEARRAEHAAITEQWMPVAMRPDLYGEPVQLKSAGMAQDQVSSLPASGSGHPMPEDVRAKMEHAFNTDFSAVRIHEGSQATTLGALAYTQGTDIHFAPGQYDPHTRQGQELLGHELTHVVQQSQGRVRATTQAKGIGINDEVELEQEADEMGARAARNELARASVRDGSRMPMNSSVTQPASLGSPGMAPGSALQKKDKELTSHRFRGEPGMTNALNKKRVIKLGDSGPHVARLQEALIAAGHPLPAYGADGHFGKETFGAVMAYQQAHGLSPDGQVGPDTMASLDQYLRLEPGNAPLPPKAGSVEAGLSELLAKGDAMTAPEAARAKTLLFQLSNDEFRVVLKQMTKHGQWASMLKKLNIFELLDTSGKLAKEVVVPITRLKPAADTIDNDFKRANEIYKPAGIEIEKGDRVDISESTTKKILGGDTTLDKSTTTESTKEELELIKRNRVKGRITAYWVPGVPSLRGRALIKSIFTNMPDDRSSVVVNESAKAQDTFAHELGHILIGPGHHADPNNLMAAGDARIIDGPGIDQLSDDQITAIKSSAFVELGKKGVGQ